MNRILKIFLLLIVFQSIIFQKMYSDVIADSARAAYTSRNFPLAIRLYKKIVESGKGSAFLYYNLGNAYYKANQLGLAIYFYEIALKKAPGDDDVLTNLKITNGKTIDKIENKGNSFRSTLEKGMLGAFSLHGWAYLSICCSALTFIGISLFVLSGVRLIKSISFWFSAAGLIVGVFSLILGYAALRQGCQLTHGIVLSPSIQVVDSPDSGAKLRFSLHEGTCLQVLSTNADWTSVKLANGNEGWVKSADIGLF